MKTLAVHVSGIVVHDVATHLHVDLAALVQVPADEAGPLAINRVEVETTRGLFEAISDASPESI